MFEPGKTVYEGKSKKNISITIRYPTIHDAHAMWSYINTLSKEKTYIRFQGEEVSIEEELSYLESQLKQMSKEMAVMLLAFHRNELIGITGIDMLDKTEKHVGTLGISVSKNFRGEGIGSLLLQFIIKEAEVNIPLLEIVTLGVFSNNVAGMKMYKQHGFIEYGNLPKGIKLQDKYADHIMMYKRIIPTLLESRKAPAK